MAQGRSSPSTGTTPRTAGRRQAASRPRRRHGVGQEEEGAEGVAYRGGEPTAAAPSRVKGTEVPPRAGTGSPAILSFMPTQTDPPPHNARHAEMVKLVRRAYALDRNLMLDAVGDSGGISAPSILRDTAERLEQEATELRLLASRLDGRFR